MKYELPVYLFILVTGVFVSAQPRPAAKQRFDIAILILNNIFYAPYRFLA